MEEIKFNEKLREAALNRLADLEKEGFKKILNPKLTLNEEFLPITGDYGCNRPVTQGRIDNLLRSVAQNGILRTVIILAITTEFNEPGDHVKHQYVVDGGGRIFGLCKSLKLDPLMHFEFLICPESWNRSNILNFMATLNTAQKQMTREELVGTYRYKEDYRMLDNTHKQFSAVSIDLCAKAFNPTGTFHRMGSCRADSRAEETDVRYGNFKITEPEAGFKAIELVDAIIREFKRERLSYGKKLGMVFMGLLSTRFVENPKLRVNYTGGSRTRLSFKNIYSGCRKFLTNPPKEVTERWYEQMITEGFRFPPSKREEDEIKKLKEC